MCNVCNSNLKFKFNKFAVLVHYNLYAYKCTYKQIYTYIYIKSLYSMYNIYQDSIYNIRIELNDIFKIL